MAQIVIYNDANTILIDDEYLNNTMVSKHSLAFNNRQVGFGRFFDFTIEYPSDYGNVPPVIALHKTDGLIALARVTNTRLPDGGWRRVYRIVGDNTLSDNFELFVFGIPQQSSGAGQGLVVLYNAQGQITFDSGLKYLRVVDFIDYRQMDSGGTASLVRSYASGTKHAVVFSQYQIRYNTPERAGGVGDALSTACICINNGIEIRAHWMKFSTNRAKYAPITNNTGLRLMVIDVTGM